MNRGCSPQVLLEGQILLLLIIYGVAYKGALSIERAEHVDVPWMLGLLLRLGAFLFTAHICEVIVAVA